MQPETKRDIAKDKARFDAKQDERLSGKTGYGAGNRDQRNNPQPTTMPSSPQTNRAKRIKP